MNSNIIRRFQHIPTMSWTSRYRNRWFIGSIQPLKGRRPPIDPRHFRWGCQTGCNLPSAPKGRGCLVWSNYFLRMENYGKLNPNISLNHTHCYCIFCSKMHSYPFLWHVVQHMFFVMCWLPVVLCKPHKDKLNPATRIRRCQWFMTTYEVNSICALK